MNPDVIIKLEAYQDLIKQSQELRELKSKINQSEALKYLELNPKIDLHLYAQTTYIDSTVLGVEPYHLGIKDLGIKNPELDKYLYKFIELFNKELLKKYIDVLDREKSLDNNAITYLKQLSLKDKLKLLAK